MQTFAHTSYVARVLLAVAGLLGGWVIVALVIKYKCMWRLLSLAHLLHHGTLVSAGVMLKYSSYCLFRTA